MATNAAATPSTSIADVAAYRKAGGRVELELYQCEGQAFIRRTPTSPNAARATKKIIELVLTQIR